MIILGLGNPGRTYAKTKHNVGFMFLDYLANHYRAKFMLDKKQKCLKATIKIKDQEVILIKPITYMNNSGHAIKNVIQYDEVTPDKLLVVYDDMALPTAQIRIRKSGSSGGHNGIKSIISVLQTDQFARLRIGIGSCDKDAINYVLSKFDKQEKNKIDNVIKLAPIIIEDLIVHGLDFIMNCYNG